MRRLWLILFLFPAIAMAQSTTVSTTGVVDTDGFTWASGTYSIQFYPSPSWPSINSYTWQGAPLTGHTLFNGPLNGSGAFSQSIPSNSAISPSGSQWTFTICPNATSGCFATNISVNGSTLNVTAQLNASAKGPRFPSNPHAFGYDPVEVTPIPQPGAVFFNNTTGQAEQWNGTIWAPLTGGAGNPAPPSFAVQLANNGATGFQADSKILINPTIHSFQAPINSGFAYATGYGDGSTNGISACAAAGLANCSADPSYPTTEQYSPTSTIPSWPSAFTFQDLRGGHNLYLVHNPPATYQPYGDPNNTDTLFYTQHDGAPVWPGDLYQLAYKMVFNSNTPGGNFDFPNLGTGSAAGWEVPETLNIQSTVYGSGIDEAVAISSNKMGSGDHVGMYCNIFNYLGGTTGLSDEGKKCLASRTQQAAAEYSATCTTGCTTGSVHVVTACQSGTNACTPIAAGPGGYAIDSTQTPLSNTITLLANSSLSSTTMSALTMGTTVPVSNGWGTQQANISTPNRMYCYYSTSSLTSVGTAGGGNSVYAGTITNGANNALAGCAVLIAGFGTSANNGSFTVVSSTATTLTLNNASGSAQSGGATSTVYPFAAMETFSITLVGGSTFDTSHSLCFATAYHECVVPTAVTNAGGGTWSITAPLRHAHANGGYVFQGGMAGYAMEIPAYTPTSGTCPGANCSTYRYLFDVLGSTDANTLQTTWWFAGRPSVLTRLTNINVGSSLYGCVNVNNVSNSGTTVTASVQSNCAVAFATPDYSNGVFLFTADGTGAVNGNCTNVAWSTKSTFTCTNASASGSHSGLTATIQISKIGQNGINIVNLWPSAEVVDVQDYTTTPPAVNGTLTLEPNPNLVIASSDVIEEQRVAADVTNGATISNFTVSPYMLEHGLSIAMYGTPTVSPESSSQGGGLTTTSNSALSLSTAPSSANDTIYKGQGGWYIPPNLINETGAYFIGLNLSQGPSANQGVITMFHSALQNADPIYCDRVWNIFETGNAPFYLQNCPNTSSVTMVASGPYTVQSPSMTITGNATLSGASNSISNANISTTGGFLSGQGINYAPFSNLLTGATWGVASAGTGTVTCAITDDLGNPACTLTQTSAASWAWHDFNLGGLTPLTLNVQYVTQIRAKGHVGGELVTITGDLQGGNVFITSAWANYCVAYTATAGGSSLNHTAGIALNANGAAIDVSNVVTAPGTSCPIIPVTTQNNQVLTLTAVNSAATITASKQISSPYYTTALEFSNGTCTTSATIAAANGNRQNVTLTNGDTCALSFTQPAAGTSSITLKVIQSSVSTFNGGISGCAWPGGVVPTITASSGAIDFIGVYLDGTNAYCVASQNFF